MSFEADYAVEGRLFAGSSSVEVVRCTDRCTGTKCAAKAYNKAKFNDHRLAAALDEGALGLSLPAHPSIVRTLACYDEPDAVTITMEFMPAGTLYTALCDAGSIPERRAARLLTDLLAGLVQLHSAGVMHRDVKPENLFLRRDGAREVLAIGDFGFATRAIPSSACVGSPQYSAPELALVGLQLPVVTRAKPLYNEKCDVWSTGVVAFVMMTGLMPFDGPTPTAVFEDVMRNNIPFNLPASQRLSPKAKDFIRALTATNPGKRPTAKEALRHPWITECLQSAR